MPAAGFVTLVGVGLTVVALALYLITIAGILNHVTRRLDRILDIIRGIAVKTQPLRGVMGEIVSDLGEVRGAVDGLVARATARAAPRAAPAGRTAGAPRRPFVVSRRGVR